MTWMDRAAVRKILRVLYENPGGLTYMELIEAARLNPRGTYSETIGGLRSAGFIARTSSLHREDSRYVIGDGQREYVGELLGVDS